MAKAKTKPTIVQPNVWGIAVVLTVIAGILFMRPYLSVIVLGLLMAFIFYPIYLYLRDKLGSEGRANAATTVVFLLAVALPVTIILALTVGQTLELVDNISSSAVITEEGGLEQSLEELAVSINSKIESIIGVKEAISQQEVSDFVQTKLPVVLDGFAGIFLSIASGVPALITMSIVYLFVFTAGLKYGSKMRETIEDISPFDAKTNSQYIERLGAMAKAMVKGQLLIAVVQGIISAAGLALVGFGDYFWFFAIFLSFLSFVPLGTGIFTIPFGIVLLLLGDFAGAAVVILNHLVVVTNIDNYIRPKVVPEDAKMPSALIMIGAFCGVAYFGFFGVIYGPMILIALQTTIQSYISYKQRISKQSA